MSTFQKPQGIVVFFFFLDVQNPAWEKGTAKSLNGQESRSREGDWREKAVKEYRREGGTGHHHRCNIEDLSLGLGAS